MSSVPTYIENHAKLTETFGYWPRFHDSLVISITLVGQQIDLVVQLWEMTSEIDDKGYFVLRNHHLVHFRFNDLSDITLKYSDRGNILFELSFSDPAEFQDSGMFQVTLDSVMDSDSEFKARRGSIIEISPCDKHGKKTEQGAAANP